MSYYPLPRNTIITNSQFIKQMNLVILNFPEFEQGMLVNYDEAGYWLELNGTKINEPLILSEARKIVMDFEHE